MSVRMKPLAVFDNLAVQTGLSDRCSELVELVRTGRTRTVEPKVAGEQSVGEEPVVGRSVGQIGFGRLVGVVRLIESQFVEEQAVGEFVAELVVGYWAAFGWWTQSGRRRAMEMGLSSPSDPWLRLFGSHVDSRLRVHLPGDIAVRGTRRARAGQVCRTQHLVAVRGRGWPAGC